MRTQVTGAESGAGSAADLAALRDRARLLRGLGMAFAAGSRRRLPGPASSDSAVETSGSDPASGGGSEAVREARDGDVVGCSPGTEAPASAVSVPGEHPTNHLAKLFVHPLEEPNPVRLDVSGVAAGLREAWAGGFRHRARLRRHPRAPRCGEDRDHEQQIGRHQPGRDRGHGAGGRCPATRPAPFPPGWTGFLARRRRTPGPGPVGGRGWRRTVGSCARTLHRMSAGSRSMEAVLPAAIRTDSAGQSRRVSPTVNRRSGPRPRSSPMRGRRRQRATGRLPDRGIGRKARSRCVTGRCEPSDALLHRERPPCAAGLVRSKLVTRTPPCGRRERGLRSSRCQRTAWARTRRSTSRPIRTMSSTPSRWEIWATS